MNGEIKSNVMPIMPVNTPWRTEPVQPVSPVGSEQDLPEGGKELPQEKVEKVTDEKVVQAVSNLNDYVQVIRRELQFSVDKESGRTVVTVVDAETGEKIRQIPREEVLALARHMGSDMKSGLIISADT